MGAVFTLFLLALSLLSPPQVQACYCIGSTHPQEAYEPYDIVITDPDETSTEILESLQSMGKTVLSYINVGYAEDWRWYWPTVSGSGVVHGLSEYKGEYLVEYWSVLWREVILNYTVAVMGEGYDGVYLDNIDASYMLWEESPAWLDGRDPIEEMGELVASVKETVSGYGGLVFVNIGVAHSLLFDGEFLSSIDGVLKEEVFFVLTGECETAPVLEEEYSQALEALSHAARAGRTVIVVEYVENPVQAWTAWILHRIHGVVPVLQPACDPDYMGVPLPSPPWGAVRIG